MIVEDFRNGERWRCTAAEMYELLDADGSEAIDERFVRLYEAQDRAYFDAVARQIRTRECLRQ